MASPPNEKDARFVLDVYSYFKGQPGLTLISNNFIALAARRHIKMSDLQGGIDYATREGWISKEPNGSLRLTDHGFERMQAG